MFKFFEKLFKIHKMPAENETGTEPPSYGVKQEESFSRHSVVQESHVNYSPAIDHPAVRQDPYKTETRIANSTREVKPSPKPVQAAPPRRVVTPRTPRRVESSIEKRVQRTSVYIGLDFGTTFTKAAYEIAPSNVHTKYSVKFGSGNSKDDYYLPSVLYFDPDTNCLSISNDVGNGEEIRYFKYNMISDALHKNAVLNSSAIITQTPMEQLCSVFFLSYVLHLIRNAVNRDYANTANEEYTSWYINMGVPLEAQKNDDRADLYKKVLEVAYLLEREQHGVTEISIQELDDFFMAHCMESNSKINILPEIYAEVLLYQQHLNTPAGFYTVVDIGGGTEDIATFLKMTDRNGEKVDCLAQNVIGYGYDALSENIVKSVDAWSTGMAKKFLGSTIDFNNDAILKDSIPREVSFAKLINARRECRTLFGTCVQRARRTRNEVLKETVSARLPMYVFVMGGASSVEFYRSSIEHMKKAQGNAGIPFFKDADVYDYLGRNTSLEIRNDQRLIISQMLAQPYEMIPEIDNMPWNLKEQDVTSKGMSWIAMHELQNELYPD